MKIEDMNEQFPFNVLEAAEVQVDMEQYKAKYAESADVRATLAYILNVQPERNAEVIQLRFQESKSLKEIGKLMAVSDESVRQRITRILRDIRSTASPEILMNGMREYHAKKLEKVRKASFDAGRAAAAADLRAALGSEVASSEFVREKIQRYFSQDSVLPNMTLKQFAEANHWSVRTLNPLVRSGIHTLAELLSYTASDVRKVRNLGENGMNEILESLENAGLSLQKEEGE